MQQRLDLLGAIVAHVVFISSIITFASRLIFGLGPGHWVGIPLLLMAFPLVYLLLKAPECERPFLYYVQVGTMLVWLVMLFLVDYVLIGVFNGGLDTECHHLRGSVRACVRPCLDVSPSQNTKSQVTMRDRIGQVFRRHRLVISGELFFVV